MATTSQDIGIVTAYGYAVAGGYTGTEQEFRALLGNIAEDLREIENLTVTVTTLAEGSSATASYSHGVLSLGIPRGNTGTAATVAVGTTTTLPEGSSATVNNSGTSGAAVLNFGIPKGDTGTAATIAVGSVTTLAPGSDATVTNSGTSGAAVLDFGIPRGAVGEVSEAELEAGLATKANTDGAYESMTVGNAEQLVSTVMVNDKAPYLFRTSGGSADIGNREYDTLVGGTIAWNQKANNSYAPTSRNSLTITGGTNTFTVDGTADAEVSAAGWFKLTQQEASYLSLQNHKLFVSYKLISGSVVGDTIFYVVDENLATIGVALGNAKIVSLGSYNSSSSRSDWTAASGAVFTNAELAITVCDLTAMFGSTIANYAYTLESGTAGAGVAWLKSYGFFSEDYYPYTANADLLSVSGVSAHEMTGFNQWDEEWEAGVISSTTGQNVASTDNIRSTNYIPIIPQTAYYLKSSSNLNLRFYDNDKNFLANDNAYGYNQTITTPSNAQYMRFFVQGDYGTTYNNDICINLSWSGYRNGEYEPYVLHSYPLDSDLTLRGVPKLDTDNNLYYDGDTYEADGTVTRRYAVVDLGTLNWTAATYGGIQGFYTTGISTVAKAPSGANLANAILAGYITVWDYAFDTDGIDKEISINATSYLKVKNSAYSTAADFKTAMSGVYLVYELATPTTENAEAFQSPQIVDDFGTERYVVTAQSGVEVPVGHSTDYPANLRDKLQHLPDLAESDGTYLIQQTDSDMALTAYVAPRGVPDAPTTDGTYVLKAVVSDGTATYQWVSE